MVKYYKHKIYNKVSCYKGKNLIIHNTDMANKGKVFGMLTPFDLNIKIHLSEEWVRITRSEYMALTGFDESVMRNYS